MPHLNVHFDANGMPLIDVDIGVAQARAEQLIKAKWPVPPLVRARLLIDSGASSTNIDSKIILALAIPPRGITQIHTPSTGVTPHSASLFDISLQVSVPPQTMRFPALLTVGSDFSASGIDGLLGRDVLANALWVYDGVAKRYSLCF